jgi:Tol biopolymer transport system component
MADSGIYVVPALGGAERKLLSTPPRGEDAKVSWSPDGKWLAHAGAVNSSGAVKIQLLSVATLEIRQIARTEECLAEGHAAFSHAGDRLAFVCHSKANDNEMGIYSVPLAAGAPRLICRFTTEWNYPGGIAWTADDKRLILSRPRIGDDFELDEVTIATGTISKLPFGQNAFSPAISVRGSRLAYSMHSQYVDVWRENLQRPQDPATKLIASTYEQESPQYSPDGKRIAFTSNRVGSWEVWVSDADGTHLVRVSDSKSSKAGSPRWSPDSQRLAFDSRESGRPEIYIVDTAERLPRKLVTSLADVSTPSWSHDGKWIYFQSTSAERIFRCPAGGGEAVMVSAEAGSYPVESDSGDSVYFFSPEKRTLRVVALNPIGTASEVDGLPRLDDRSHYTVVAGGIYFVPADQIRSIRYLDFATRKVSVAVDLNKENMNGLSVSPDGQWILYTQVGAENADLMLVDHFL